MAKKDKKASNDQQNIKLKIEQYEPYWKSRGELRCSGMVAVRSLLVVPIKWL
jgi:hypothetical protein